ncbi:hypothetical protein [Luteimonas salinilitoris]|uniref:Serine protease n=1 Tax=Luteimonas salinilitoris TaxID=3237697 RepID=A0ABV4HPR2_9GAMM
MTDATQRQLTATRAFLREFLRTDPFRRYGAHAVGVGRKLTGGKASRRIALRVYTARKVPEAELPAERRVPARFRWSPPGRQEQVAIITDVIESLPGHVQMPDPESRIRPVPGGVSGSAMGSGTLGGWVWDTLDDSIVILSNAHVFGYAAGEPILQPAKTDGGQLATDRIGEVKRAVDVDPVEGPSPWPLDQCNFVDAAIGSVTSSALIDLTVLEIGPAVYATAIATGGMAVEKSGQTTGHVQGVVDDVDYAAAFATPLAPGNWQTVAYCDLIRFVPSQPGTMVSMDGDSGALLFTPDPDSVINPAVGLHFAGADNGSYGVACKIQNVFAELGVDVLCAGGFAAFLDALADDGRDFEAALAASLFEPRPPQSKRRTLRLHRGLARDVQRRLRDSETGCQIVAFVDRHRAELLSMLLTHGDVRRSAVGALRPILRGATTTDRVFTYILGAEDMERVGLAFDTAIKTGSKALAADIRRLRRKLDGRIDESIGAIIER